MKRTLIVFALVAVMSLAAHADSVTFTIKDIGNFGGYVNSNTSDTYTGTGFVGLYGPGVASGDVAFAHLMGLEQTNFSATALNVDISGLTGATINNANFSFNVNSGGSGEFIVGTNFAANGTLGTNLWTPASLGSFTGQAFQGGNAYNVTNLLQNRVTAGDLWFGLTLHGTDQYEWTYTSGFGGDDANMRLTVDYTPGNAVPEPGSLALLGTGLVGLAGSIRRRLS